MEKMSRPLPLNPTFIPPPYGVLRSLLENPLKLPLHHEDAFSKDKDKEKKLDDESNSPTVPQSAFLGPTLWDKTLPYDGDTFQLEYMDLEEFLSENGIPPSPSQHDHSPHPPGLQPVSSAAPSVMDLSSRASAPLHPGIPSPNCMQSPIRPGQLLPANRNTPSPIDPDTIQVPVGYEPDPADLALSSIPGQEMFDPRKRKFSEEELKPQPMIKKARKVFIPDDLKKHRQLISQQPVHTCPSLLTPIFFKEQPPPSYPEEFWMTSTGQGAERTTWQPSAPVTPGG
ncbi:hepatic leukemia factor isoform X6 [Callithrix jacchus]|uniref:hepatic leukemia factor isoform X6 n=1 Tax=Callithrix jacchus TaxID=9483 RepID=UPI0023DCF6BC|nr:hepatic leukemia factor isoform X6 [Callithrix jacchus]